MKGSRESDRKSDRVMIYSTPPGRLWLTIVLILFCQFAAAYGVLLGYGAFEERTKDCLMQYYENTDVTYDRWGFPVQEGGADVNSNWRMPRLDMLMRGTLVWLLIIVTAIIIVVVNHYMRFYREHSIYVMKRIPSRTELHVRCLFVPVVLLLEALLVAFLFVRYCDATYARYIPLGASPTSDAIDYWRLLIP